MNKEEILAMEAGLELDMLVGQYVIGFEDYLKESGKRPVVRDGRYGKNYFDLPNYSTDISAAWEVVEKLRETHCYKIYDYGRNMHKNDPHHVTFSPSEKGWEHSNEARASTAPEAICKAALLAVMEETT